MMLLIAVVNAVVDVNIGINPRCVHDLAISVRPFASTFNEPYEYYRTDTSMDKSIQEPQRSLVPYEKPLYSQ